MLELPEFTDPVTVPELIPEVKIFQVQKEGLEEWAEKMDISYVGDLNDWHHQRRYP